MIELLEKEKQEKRINKLSLVNNLIDARENFYLYGKAGTGKTQLILEIAKEKNLTVKSQSVTPLTTKGEFYGFISVNGDKYIPTPFREAYENGYVFLLDEMDNISQSLAVSLNQSLSQDVLTFPDTTIKKHENFIFIGTGNTCNGGNSSFQSRQKFDSSFKDRFIFLEWDFSKELELKLSKNENFTLLIQNIREVVENYKIDLTVSMRSSIFGSKLYNQGNLSLLDILEISLFKGSISRETRDKILMNVSRGLIESLINKEEEKESIDEEMKSESIKETIEIKKEIEVEINFKISITSPEYIEKYKNLGYEICTLDTSGVQKKNNLKHFDGLITLEKLKALKNENVCFVTHTQEKKNLIKLQLQSIGVLK